MKTYQEMVREFHEAMGQPVGVKFDTAPMDLVLLRRDLIREEINEIIDATSVENLLKEYSDLIYVVVGACVTFGWDIDEAFRRVHESNMSKLVDGKPLLRDDGKVMKGPNYKPADLSDLV